MRGRPVIEFVLFAMAWLALLLPIYHVTRNVQAKPAESSAALEEGQVWLSLRFSVTPSSFEIRQDGRTLWVEPQAEGKFFDREVSLALDDQGADLTISAVLPSGESVVEVVIEPDGSRKQSQTLWVDGSFEQTVTYQRGDR